MKLELKKGSIVRWISTFGTYNGTVRLIEDPTDGPQVAVEIIDRLGLEGVDLARPSSVGLGSRWYAMVQNLHPVEVEALPRYEREVQVE